MGVQWGEGQNGRAVTMGGQTDAHGGGGQNGKAVTVGGAEWVVSSDRCHTAELMAWWVLGYPKQQTYRVGRACPPNK
jgi:hypothetical protein